MLTLIWTVVTILGGAAVMVLLALFAAFRVSREM